MLIKTVCNKVLESQAWKLWQADVIVKMQIENGYTLVPEEVFTAALKQIFNIEDASALYVSGALTNLYMQRFGNDRPNLKWMLKQIPKSCAYSLVK